MSPETKKKVFEKLALPHLDGLYRYAYALLGDSDKAEDLVQETFLRAFNGFESFQEGTNIRAWLFRILKNTFINQFHREKRYEELNGDLPQDEAYEKLVATGKAALQSHSGAQNGFGDEVSKALEGIPQEFRNAVYLADVEELAYEEIASILDVPVGTVRSRIARGRKLLQLKLRSYAVEEGYIIEEKDRNG